MITVLTFTIYFAVSLGSSLSPCEVSLAELNRLNNELENYEKQIQLKPDVVQALINRGNVLRKLNRFEDGLQSYDQAIAKAFCNRGFVLTKLNRFEDALQSFDRAIEHNSDDAITLCNRGKVLEELYRFDDALESYDKGIELNPDEE